MEKSIQEYTGVRQMETDEKDLKELFIKIWEGKRIIGTVVLVSAVTAFITLSLVPSYYRIETTIDTISPDQLRSLMPSILGSSEYQVPAPDGKKIYDRV